MHKYQQQYDHMTTVLQSHGSHVLNTPHAAILVARAVQGWPKSDPGLTYSEIYTN